MTGVSAATLRAWERRYHIPAPARSESAYRLYSDADVELVRRMRSLCSAGHSAAEAAALVRDTGAEEQPPAQIVDPWTQLRRDLLHATEVYNYQSIENILLKMSTVGPASLVYEEVMAPVLVEIGERWHRGEMSVAQEHLLSTLIETSLRNMLQMVQAADALHLAVLTCYEGEAHSLGLFGIGLRLAGWGFRVVIMSPGLPPSGLRDAVNALHPHLVALSCVQQAGNRDMDAITAAYADACGNIPWIVGGAGAEAIRDVITKHGGLHASGTMSEVRHQLNTLVGPRW